jgi:hypothetical protein
MTDTSFTLDGYRDLVAGILSREYTVRSFHDVDPASPQLVLRHDIDQSIQCARAMAQTESENGWHSTWFVLLRTEMYNPFSRAAATDLRAMIAAGHEIGLHLDTTHYDGDDALEDGALRECRMLEEITRAPVRIVSFHRPRPERLGGDARIGGRLHTYMDRFTRSMGYCSDSRGEWRHGHPHGHDALRDKRALQLLTHAIWWVGPPGQTARERLADLLETRGRTLDRELADNNLVWSHRSDA